MSQFEERKIGFHLGAGRYDLNCAIYDKTHAAIVETATFFWSLKAPGEHSYLDTRLGGTNGEHDFVFSALQPEQLARIVDANPTRRMVYITCNAEQSAVFATRPFPMNWRMHHRCIEFEDKGTAFVDALGKRQSPFGSLCIDSFENEGLPFSQENFERLFKLEIFEKLDICGMREEIVLLPLSAKVNALTYQINARYLQPSDFDSINIAAKHLNLSINLFRVENWDVVLISLFHRLAKLGHLERFTISANDYSAGDQSERFESDKVALVTEALVHAIKANANMTYFKLNNNTVRPIYLYPRLRTFFEAMEEHKGLRTFDVGTGSYQEEDPDYSSLERLLSRNRNIEVLDHWGLKITDRCKIDKLYALNRLFNGSKMLMKEQSASLRPVLVTAALAERAPENFQYIALLLADHTDMLCELIKDKDFETPVALQRAVEGKVSTATNGATNNSPTDRVKRKPRVQPPRAAKKVVRYT